MQFREQAGFRGEYEIEILDTVTGEREIQKLHNTLTNINKDIHLAMLLGITTGYSFTDLDIKYFAFGDGSTAATATQTKLINERFRKQITTKERPSGQNYVESIVSLGSPDANFVIREIGVFAGSTATSTKDSGKMISRIVVNIEKFENKIINIIRRDFITI